jgi:putative spermidine/putrescine transport system permease protein
LLVLGLFNITVQSFGYIPAYGLESFTFEYYRAVLTSPQLGASFRVSLGIALISALLASMLGTLLCAAITLTKKLNSTYLGEKFIEIIKLPIAVPHTIAALFVIQFFSQSGLLARIMYAFGLVDAPEAFPALLYQPNSIGIILAYLWKEIPFVAYFVLSLMRSIDRNLGETAENLGANPNRAFFEVTLPLCMPAITKAFFIIFAFAFASYELPFRSVPLCLGPCRCKPILSTLIRICFTVPMLWLSTASCFSQLSC